MDDTAISRDFQEGRGRGRGLSLIEVMVVVAIIGVLATIGYPSYRESIAKGRRTQATAQLVAAQQWMERFFSENLRYDQTTGGTAVTASTQFGRFSTVPPPNEGPAFYNLTLDPVSTQGTFTIRATRVGSMLEDRCGDLTLDHLSRKGFVASTYSGFANVNAARAYCWR